MTAGDKRRLSKDDLSLLSAGIVREQQPKDYVLALARQLERLFQRAKRDGSVDRPLEFLFSFINASTKREWPKSNPACEKGCSFCCNQWVSVTAPEAFYLARRIRGKPRAHDVAVAHEARSEVRHNGRLAITSPCPLLKDNACSVYDSRPVLCRLTVSASVEACRRAYVEMTGETIREPGLFPGQRFVVQTALAAALVRCSLPTVAYELSAAVDRAIRQPELEGRWLAGEDVFAGLPRDPVDPGAGVNVKALTSRDFAASAPLAK